MPAYYLESYDAAVAKLVIDVLQSIACRCNAASRPLSYKPKPGV